MAWLLLRLGRYAAPVLGKILNDASSIAVLGNGRATDLPVVAGRGIWKNGIEMIEVQTPFLDPEAAEKLLGPADNVKKTDETTTQAPEPRDVTNSWGPLNKKLRVRSGFRHRKKWPQKPVLTRALLRTKSSVI